MFVFRILQSIGLIELRFDSNHLLSWVFFGSIVVVPVLIWLQVNWSLAYVIAVVESERGYETLRRSAGIWSREEEMGCFQGILLYYGLLTVLMVVCCAMFLVLVGAAKGEQWREARGDTADCAKFSDGICTDESVSCGERGVVYVLQEGRLER
ncbi:hypothetical protein HAX54_033294 [Datura stramonium]|uniref:Uncharacterized protein n=1 Tax=Datura stramonium TaxID=4076 RepID=A0ABS8SD47_DATST|nr:hypothetical protein [Datura stramonium]